jgi:segregation and condensation protein A
LFSRNLEEIECDGGDSPFIEATLFDLISAFSKILKSISKEAFHQVIKDEFTVAEKVHEIFHILLKQEKVLFTKLFREAKNKFEIITIFLAILELIRLKEVVIIQNKLFDDIELCRNSSKIDAPNISNSAYEEI